MAKASAVEEFKLTESVKHRAQKAWDSTCDAAKKYVIKPSQEAIETINGQAVLNEVRAYMAEEEKINSALVTRVLKIERDFRFLKYIVVGLAVAEALHWILR